MMVTLYKTDKAGRLRFCIVHDLQRSLLGGFALTVVASVGEKTGADALRVFESEKERAAWLNRLIAGKRRAGYRELYRYGREARVDAPAVILPSRRAG